MVDGVEAVGQVEEVAAEDLVVLEVEVLVAAVPVEDGKIFCLIK